jgi:hypothetical protein
MRRRITSRSTVRVARSNPRWRSIFTRCARNRARISSILFTVPDTKLKNEKEFRISGRLLNTLMGVNDTDGLCPLRPAKGSESRKAGPAACGFAGAPVRLFQFRNHGQLYNCTGGIRAAYPRKMGARHHRGCSGLAELNYATKFCHLLPQRWCIRLKSSGSSGMSLSRCQHDHRGHL